MLRLKALYKDKTTRLWAIIIAALYYVLYLFSVGNLLFGRTSNGVDIVLQPTWQSIIFRQRVLFLWEPFGVLKISSVEVLLSLNMILGLALAFLIAVNFAAVIFLYRLPKQCRIDFEVKGIWAVLPSFLTGFACCVPTFLIPFASLLSGIAVYFIKIRPFLIPLAVGLLLWSIHYTIKKIPESYLK